VKTSGSHIHEVDQPERPVLIVEDEGVGRRALTALLRAHGFAAESAATAEEALALLETGLAPSVALVDLDLPGMSGAEFIERMEQMNAGIDPILITAADREKIKRVLDRHPMACMQKPLDLDQLVVMLNAKRARH
jgi:CheY-like chemotaxis protein